LPQLQDSDMSIRKGKSPHSHDRNFLSQFKVQMSRGRTLNSVEFMKIWCHYDKDESGYLDVREFESFISDFIRHKGGIPAPGIVGDLRKALLETCDSNHNGKIELAEFSNMLPVEENFMAQFEQRSKFSRSNFNAVFNHYDPDGNGFIEGQELLALIRDIMTKTGKNVSQKEIQDYRVAVLRVFDKNSDGRLSRSELGLLLSISK